MKANFSIPSILRASTTAALLITGDFATGDTIDWKTIGGWDISFYPASEGCQAFAMFEDDTAFFIGFENSGGTLNLGITLLDERWRSIEDGTEYSITARFGNESPWTLAMDGVRVDEFPGLNLLIDANSDQADLFIDEFQRKGSMTWSFGDSTLGRYTLKGSRKAFNEVVACQTSYLEATSDSTDPFTSSDPFTKEKKR